MVVGRRGTGKSALAWKLGQTWQADAKMVVIKITPTEDAVLGLRSLCGKLGDFARTRAFFRIAWKVAMGRESLCPLVTNYKYKSHASHGQAQAVAQEWQGSGGNIVERLFGLVRQQLTQTVDPDATIGQLQRALDWTVLESTLSVALAESKLNIALVIDRADEGYKPDDLGIAIVAGLVHAAIEMSNQFLQLMPIVFLRDNIARAMAEKDDDYARVVENRAIRLHWGDRELFDMASERIRIALGLDVESSKAVWNRFVLEDIKDIDGFRKCLRHTLYRPRDVLVLLNKAYYNAHKKGANRIDYSDIEATAKTISANRLSDLFREYEAVAPGLEPLVRGLGGQAAQFSRDSLTTHLDAVIQDDRFDGRTQQGLQIIDTSAGAIRLLYEFGVIGALDSTSGSFAFCHDGHELVQDLTQASRFLVHPCYWMALDMHGGELPGDREEIYDEYEITAIARTPQQRVANINRLVGKLAGIAIGADGAADFEQWCHKALCTLFAGQIRNLQLKPNAQAPNRRDIVGRNGGEGGVWRQLVEDYGVRQVVFEVKNYVDLNPDDLRQISDYLVSVRRRRERSMDPARVSAMLAAWAGSTLDRGRRAGTSWRCGTRRRSQRRLRAG